MRLRYSESEIIKTSVGDHDVFSGENITTSAGGHIHESCDGEIIYGNPETAPELKLGNYFKKGYWTNHKDEPITRAVYGQKLKFHIEFDIEYATVGDTFEFGLYDDDKYYYPFDLVKTTDDHIELARSKSGALYNTETIGENGKTVLVFTSTNLEKLTDKLDKDKIFELYFKCTYNGKTGIETIDLPARPTQYLKLGALVIDRYKMPGLNLEGTDVADDMTFGKGIPDARPIFSDIDTYIQEYTVFGFDETRHAKYANLNTSSKAIYTTAEIKNLGTLMERSANSHNEDLLWIDFRNMAKDNLSSGDLSTNIDLMIKKFKGNTGGVYENEMLAKAIINNPATEAYCNEVEKYIASQLKQKSAKLEEVEDKEPYFRIEEIENGSKNIVFFNSKGDRSKIGKRDFKSPAYTWKKNWNVLRGETIALNDIWATEVVLKEIKTEGDSCTVHYHVTLWDHFGLDSPDMEKFYSYGSGFRAWFVLQHLFGYKPFLTKIQFDKQFKFDL